MKKNLFVLAILLFFGAYSYAQLIVVTLHSNGTTTPYYNNTAFVDAYNASVAGDTIILPGGFFNPPSSINKRLTIIGTGHYADSTVATGITNIISSINIGANAGGIKIEGLYINGSIVFATNQAINNVIIKRNYINGNVTFDGDKTVPSQNALVINNVIAGNVNANNTNGLILSNNLIYTTVYYVLNGVVQNNIIFTHDYWDWPHYSYFVFYDANASLIKNNIILNNNNVFYTGAVNNSVNNNLFRNTPGFGSSISSGNYFNIVQDSIFVNQTGNAFNYNHNYHLKSPTTYLGTDSTQIGIYGGLYPYKEGAVPFNPHIQTQTIAPTTTPSGNLNINIKVKAQNE